MPSICSALLLPHPCGSAVALTDCPGARQSSIPVLVVRVFASFADGRILQGHEGAVSALAFSASGDQVVSVSVPDRTLRWWQVRDSLHSWIVVSAVSF